jgi:dihydroorotase
MKILIQNAQIVNHSHPLHGKKADIFIEDGVIKKISENISINDCEIIRSENLHVSIGWMDCFANFCDPGFEYKENISTGAKAAAAGGFTDVMVIPDTLPSVSNKSQVDYLLQQAVNTNINIHPIGSITQNLAGKELAEMYDMSQAGAVAFSDGRHPIQSAGILQKALEYLLAIDAVIIQLPDNNSIGTHGQMNEGVVSTQLGLPGKPAISEEIMIARDIELVKYTGSKIHFTGISTQKSLSIIAEAKKENLNVTCSVTPYHLFFNDEALQDYDTTLKVNPPLRTGKDREAMIQGVTDGTIDFIASHHQPEDYDHKVCEFEKAEFGMETLETVFGASLAAGISFERFVSMQTENIRRVFGLKVPRLEEGAAACLTLFNPDEKITFTEEGICSMSHNNAFINKRLYGKVLGTINKNKLFLTRELKSGQIH